MKTNDIRKMSTEEITKKIEELKSELFDMRMKQATAALEKSHKINEDRKTIARLKTVLSERLNEGGEQ
ncbi:MAG: 50S ribosomal protein L29 [Bacilli bacterium]|nr:50S ribosomal protein L29 [Bacilli bacterium]